MPTPRRITLTACLLCSGAGLSLAQDQPQDPYEGPWNRHTIDDTSRGADGVRLGDINGDGLMDIVTGWEEGGITRLYLHPGPEEATEPWPAVTVGQTPNVEDAVLVDLDGDGALDVVSSCEGRTRTVFVHWNPNNPVRLMDPDAWVTEPIPATVGEQMWMYCLPMEVDGENGPDLIVGSKGNGAAVGWLESPTDPRDLEAWRYHHIRDAGWIMSLEASDRTDFFRVLVTDRRGPTRGTYLLEPGTWQRTDLELGGAEYMFGDAGFDLPFVVATRNGYVQLFPDPFQEGDRVQPERVPNPFGVRAGKAAAVGQVDSDEVQDLVVSYNTSGQRNAPGVAWVRVLPNTAPDQWPAHDIAGPEGTKFDRIELVDLDGDGDLDVLTCEEIDGLGVIWYENPFGPAGSE